jgi:hypothetical protein
MSLLNVVDKPGSDIEKYVEDLDKVLLNKISIISKLREQLLNFHKHLKTEEEMSTLHKTLTAQEVEKSTQPSTSGKSRHAEAPPNKSNRHAKQFDVQDEMLLDDSIDLPEGF